MNRPERRAQELVQEHGIDRPPVPVEVLAQKCGATVRYRNFDGDISGLLLRDEGRKIIGVHSGQAKTRQRFTIAHELGHLMLHPRGRPVIVEHLWRGASVNWRDGSSGQASDREEIEANQFAAALLMPQALVDPDYWRLVTPGTTEDVIINLLARRYDVSPQAMRFRLLNLALLDPV